jgi:hypothetical protein
VHESSQRKGLRQLALRQHQIERGAFLAAENQLAADRIRESDATASPIPSPEPCVTRRVKMLFMVGRAPSSLMVEA